MAVRIIVDSASDILPEEAEKLGMLHCPLTIMFGSTEYRDAVDITHKEFYEKLVASEALPTTSQVTPAAFADAYEQVVSQGDTAVVITISSKLSGTYQSAMLAAGDYEGKVFVVDSENAALGERIIAMRALDLTKQGLSAAEIAARLEEEKKKVRLFARLDTLEYLKKGGRISSTVAFVGGVLSIKPVIAVVNGVVELVGKARGAKQSDNLLRTFVKESAGIDLEKPYTFTFSGVTDEATKKFIQESPELWNGKAEDAPICSVGATIGTHVGPGAVGIAYFEK